MLAKHFTITPSEIDSRFSSYATPLVSTFRRAVNTDAQNVGLIETRLVQTFETILKYLVGVLVAQYKKDGLSLAHVNSNLEKLGRPSLGLYAEIFRTLTRFYSKTEIDLFREMGAFLEDGVDDPTFDCMRRLSKLIDYPAPSNLRTYKHLLDVLVAYRNKILAHGASADTRQYLDGRLPDLGTLVLTLLHRLRFAAELRLLEIQSVEKTPDGTKTKLTVWNGLLPRRSEETLPWELEPGHLFFELHGASGAEAALDLFPICISAGGEGEGARQIYFLNGLRNKKAEYLSYTSGDQLILTPAHPEFESINRGLSQLGDGPPGLPPHMKKILEVSEDSRTGFNRARVELADGDTENAMELLKYCIEKSPGFNEAVSLLAALQQEQGDLESAHDTLSQYLELVPDDGPSLLEDCRTLLRLDRLEEAWARLRQRLDANPADPVALALQDELQGVHSAEETVQQPVAQSRRLLLPYEYLAQSLTGSSRRAYRTTLALIGLTTASLAGLFLWHADVVMALTTGSIGFLFCAIVWATFRIRRLLAESRPNFAAFLRTPRGSQPDALFYNLVVPGFGDCPSPGRGLAPLAAGLSSNPWRFAAVFLGAIFLTVWFFRVTMYSPDSAWVDFAFGLYAFLFSLAFSYLLSCVGAFQILLRKLRFQRIHFSLVQHPKLSIRYLSHLSRRVSYPLLLIYVIATFTAYLGPFKANIAFVLGLSLLLVMVCYSYYSTIFLVRSVIIRNKWRLISQFSVHFDKPIAELVKKAQPASMSRIRDLIEMRDFIDSMDVWAERKLVLAGVSFLFLTILAFSTIGMSNLMTRFIVPEISRQVDRRISEARPRARSWLIPADSLDGSSVVQVSVAAVDDTFLVGWADAPDKLLEKSLWQVGPESSSPPRERPEAGFRRADWKARDLGMFLRDLHGAEDFSIPLGRSQNLLLVAFNKVYHGFLWMGGGKFSYQVEVVAEGAEVFQRRGFVRINTSGIGFIAHLKLEKRTDGILVSVREGHSALGLDFLRHADWLQQQLLLEEEASVLAAPR